MWLLMAEVCHPVVALYSWQDVKIQLLTNISFVLTHLTGPWPPEAAWIGNAETAASRKHDGRAPAPAQRIAQCHPCVPPSSCAGCCGSPVGGDGAGISRSSDWAGHFQLWSASCCSFLPLLLHFFFFYFKQKKKWLALNSVCVWWSLLGFVAVHIQRLHITTLSNSINSVTFKFCMIAVLVKSVICLVSFPRGKSSYNSWTCAVFLSRECIDLKIKKWSTLCVQVTMGSPSCIGDVLVYIKNINQPSCLLLFKMFLCLKLEAVTSFNFKYLASVVTNEGSKREILSRTAQTTATLIRLKPVWNDRSISQFQDMTDALPCHVHLPVCLWIMDPHSRAPKKNTSHGIEVLLQDTMHPIQRPCYQPGSLC